MWNERLNEKFTNRLIGYCQDKRVLVVGNSISLFNEPRGDFIDSFDVVVRMGKGYPWPEFKAYLGSRTDVWMLSNLRANHYKDFVGTPYQVLNISQMSIYDNDKKTTSITKEFYEDDFQVYKDYFLMGNIRKTKALIKIAYGKVDIKQRASQGALTLAYFTNVIKSYKELHIYGFDFFEGKIRYDIKGEINEVSSFHIPIPTNKGINSNPHAGMYVKGHPDKDYILRLKEQNKIIFHPMKPLEQTEETKQKIQVLMDKYRRSATFIEAETSEFTGPVEQ